MLALALLVIAGDMIRSFIQLRHQPPGFRTENLVTLRVSLPEAKYGQNQFSPSQIVTLTLDSVAERIASLPGVRDVAYATLLPRSQSDPRSRFTLPEQRESLGGEAPIASWRAVSANYFTMMGIRILDGRGFDPQDKFGQDLVIVVSNALARRYFPGESAVGKQLFLFDAPRRIVGVAGDVLVNRSADAPGCIYLPHAQSPRLSMSFLVRTATDPSSILANLPATVWEIDRDQPVSNVMTYEKYADLQFAGRRLTTTMLIAFCVLALIMAAVGLYGLISYLVVQRTKDFGIRMALGASRADIFASVMREALLVTVAGAVAGAALLAVARRALSGFFGDILQGDWVTPVAVACLLVIVTALASFMPAARATYIEPATALRES
jgi:putative ABC transport system permease protein